MVTVFLFYKRVEGFGNRIALSKIAFMLHYVYAFDTQKQYYIPQLNSKLNICCFMKIKRLIYIYSNICI